MSPSARYGGHIGGRFGKLVFVAIPNRRGDNNRILGDFSCDCGKRVELPLGRMLAATPYRTHCGCETDHSGAHSTHGKRYSPEYRSWVAMKGRCLNPLHKDYPRWGARGVAVCGEWASSFEAFFAHVGSRPAGTTLDRIDNLRGYEPGNVRWATPHQQQTNRSTTYIVQIDGIEYPSVEDAARALCVSSMTIVRWCDGYTDQRRVHQVNGGRIPPRPNCKRELRYAA